MYKNHPHSHPQLTLPLYPSSTPTISEKKSRNNSKMKRITPSVVLLVGILSLFSPVTPAPPTGSGIPGLPREFQNVNVENYLRVSE